MIAAILLIVLGIIMTYQRVTERTGCGCLGVLVAGLLFALLVVAKLM